MDKIYKFKITLKSRRVWVVMPWTEGRYTKGEILRHVIAHEIHHMGQLSIWAREIGLQPVSANVIGRGLFNDHK